MASSPVPCSGKSRAAQPVGLFRYLGGSLTRRPSEERSLSPSRGHGPTLDAQGSHATPPDSKTVEAEVAQLLQTQALIKHSGETLSSSQKRALRNPVQLSIDSHGPVPDRINFQDGKKHMPAYQNKTQKPFQLFSCISMETRGLSQWKDFSFLINPPC